MQLETAISQKAVAKLAAGANVVAIVPTTIEEAFRLAELITQSGLAPDQLKTPQAITIVLLKGLEIGLPPMAALECIGIVNNKACLHSDGIPALLWSRGFKIKEWYEHEDKADELAAHCEITRPNGDTYAFRYSVKDAKENQLWGKKAWGQYGKRMLRMRCRGWLARDCATDVLKGIPIYEEQADLELSREEYRDVKVAARPALAIEDIPDEPAAAKEEPPKEGPAKAPTRTDDEFKNALEAAFATAKDIDALNEHLLANEEETSERGLEQWVRDTYEARRKRLY